MICLALRAEQLLLIKIAKLRQILGAGFGKRHPVKLRLSKPRELATKFAVRWQTAITQDLGGALWRASGTLNGEEFTAEDLAELADGMDEQLSSFSGESTIAYIAPHALVLDEEEASISCWR